MSVLVLHVISLSLKRPMVRRTISTCLKKANLNNWLFVSLLLSRLYLISGQLFSASDRIRMNMQNHAWNIFGRT